MAGPLGVGNAARRRVRLIVGVGMGLQRHDGEVDAFLLLGIRGRARYAQAHVQNTEATVVFHMYFRAGRCDSRNLSTSLARP